MCLWSCFFSWGRRFRTHLFIYSLLFAKALSMHNTGSHAPNNACNQRSVSLYANIALHRHPPRIEWKLCVREFVCVWERASIAERRRRTTRERWRRYTCVQCAVIVMHSEHNSRAIIVFSSCAISARQRPPTTSAAAAVASTSSLAIPANMLCEKYLSTYPLLSFILLHA